jgi:hypothetical protein
LGDAIAESIIDLARDVGSMAPPVTRSSARVMPSSATQRFDSMLVCLQRFVWNCNGCIRFLAQVATSDDMSAPWALDLLGFLTYRDGEPSPKNLLLLILLAEFIEVCSRFVHGHESGNSHRHHIAHTASLIKNMDRELSDLFDVKTESGAPRLPLALSKHYTHGYVNVVRECLTLGTTTSLTSAGKIAWYRQGSSDEELQSWVLTELGSILNIKKLFLATIHAEFHMTVAMAMMPFDIEAWRPRCNEHVNPIFEPLAQALRIDLARLCDQFMSLFPAAVRLYDDGWRDLSFIWGEVMRNTTPRNNENLAEIGEVILFMLAAFPGTGEVESNFAALQAMSSHRRAGAGIDVLTACMKVVLDGPPPSEFVHFDRPGCVAKYSPTALSSRSQNWYFFLFGGRKFSQDKSDIVVFGTRKKGQRNVGSMAEALVARMVQQQCYHDHHETMDASAVDAVEGSQLQRWSGAQTKTFRDRTTKDLTTKELKLQDDAASDCEDFWIYSDVGTQMLHTNPHDTRVV